jgi:hypothetical protein
VSVGEATTSSLCNIEKKLLFERKELALLCIVLSASKKIQTAKRSKEKILREKHRQQEKI